MYPSIMNKVISNRAIVMLILIIVILLFPNFGFAQQLKGRNEINLFSEINKIESLSSLENYRSLLNSKENDYPSFYHVITDVPKDFLNFSSVVFRNKSIGPVIFLSTITAGLIVSDHKTYLATNKLISSSKTLNSFLHTMVETGNSKWHLGLSGAAFMFGYLTDDIRLKNTAFQTAEAVIASGLFVQILKRISGRQSPAVYTKPGGYWDFFPDLGEYQHRQPEYYAFPSGHITSATTFLTVISENYPEIKWLKPVSYVLIGLLGVSLVANDMHWYSDLPLGIAIGYTFGKIVSGRYLNNNKDFLYRQKNITLIPSISNGNFSVLFNYSF